MVLRLRGDEVVPHAAMRFRPAEIGGRPVR